MTDIRSYRKPPSGVDKSVLTWDRLWILDHIVDSNGEASFQSLAFYLDLTSGSLNNHLGKLEEADLVRVEKQFVDKKPVTKAVMTTRGWRAYDDLDAQMREWTSRNDERRPLLDQLNSRKPA